MSNRTTPFNIRLSKDDFEEFNGLCHKFGKNRTEMARQLIRESMARHKQEEEEEMVNQFAVELKKQTDRIIGVLRKNNLEFSDRVAGLLAKMALNDATVFNVLYHKTDEEARQELFTLARRQAIEMVTAEVKGELTVELLESLRNALSGEA